MYMGNFIERLQYYMQKKGINDNQMTVNAGLSIGLIGKAKSSKKGMNSTNIEKILLACPDINPDWLLTGRGEMLKTKRTSEEYPSHQESVSDHKVTQISTTEQTKSEKNSDHHPPQGEILLAILREKDEVIKQLAEEIGRLKARIEELERRRGDNAGHAPSSAMADAG